MTIRILRTTALLFLLASAGSLQADGRSFVWTYQYQTMQRGAAEFEYCTTHIAAEPHHGRDHLRLS